MCVKLPLVAFTAMLKVPRALPGVATVIVVLPEPETLDGEKLTLEPLGPPLALKVTPPVKPPLGMIVIVQAPERPCRIVIDAGDAETAKSPTDAALTTSVTLFEWVSEVLDAVIVIV